MQNAHDRLADEFGTANLDDLAGRKTPEDRASAFDRVERRMLQGEIPATGVQLDETDDLWPSEEFCGPPPSRKEFLPNNQQKLHREATRLRHSAEEALAEGYGPRAARPVQSGPDAEEAWGGFAQRHPELAADRTAAERAASELVESGARFKSLPEFYDALASRLANDDEGRTSGIGGHKVVAAPAAKPNTAKSDMLGELSDSQRGAGWH